MDTKYTLLSIYRERKIRLRIYLRQPLAVCQFYLKLVYAAVLAVAILGEFIDVGS